MRVQYSYTSTPPIGRTACTEPQCLYSRAIPLLPLWGVRPVQNLSACTVQLYLYSPQCLYSTAIPLLPLWAIQPVQSLSACTVQLYLYSPQCLYSTAIPLLPLLVVRPVQSLSACTRVQFTFYLPNTSLDRYRYTSLISNEDIAMKGALQYATTDPVLK